MIKAVFFDLDNTLYPTSIQAKECRDAALDAMIRTMHESEFQPVRIPSKESLDFDLEEIIKQTGANADNHFDLLLRRHDIEFRDLIMLREAARNEYHKQKFNKVRPWPDVETTLKNLEKKYILGIITNGRVDKQLSKLDLLHLVKYFNSKRVIIEEDVGYSKPHKEIFNRAAASVNLKPENCAYVGDKPKQDIWGAFNAGFVPILYKGGPYFNQNEYLKEMNEGQDYHSIKHFSELIDLIPKL